MSQSGFYKPLKYTSKSTPLYLALLLVFAIVAGVLYARVTWAYPRGYMNSLILSVTVTIVTYLFTRLGVKWAKVRSLPLGLTVVFLASILFSYTQWAVYLSRLDGIQDVHNSESLQTKLADESKTIPPVFWETEATLSQALTLASQPTLVVEKMSAILQQGEKRIRPNEDMTTVRLRLYLWIGELLLFLLPGLFFSWRQMRIPFSTQLDRWYEGEKYFLATRHSLDRLIEVIIQSHGRDDWLEEISDNLDEFWQEELVRDLLSPKTKASGILFIYAINHEVPVYIAIKDGIKTLLKPYQISYHAYENVMMILRNYSVDIEANRAPDAPPLCSIL